MAGFERVDELMRRAVSGGAFPGAQLVIGCRERVLFRRAYGRLYPEGRLCDLQTRVDLASLPKPLVGGMRALRAGESGRLCLWDTLGSFVDAPPDKRDITIRQLLTHTAGFTPGLHLWERTDDPAQSAELLLSAPLSFPPGTSVRYCCAGYLLLGQLLECLYGQDLATLAGQEVFWPLGWTDAGYLPAGGNIAATERQPDGTLLTGVVHDENARFLGGVAGNAGVFASADDLTLWMRMLASEGALPDGTRYLSAPTVRAAFRNQTEGMAQARGLGFYLPWYDDGYTGDLFPPETIGHTGFTGTSVTLDPTSGLYVILLTNRVCPARGASGIYRVRRLLHNAAYAAFS